MMVDWKAFFPPGARVLALPNWQRPRLYLPAQSFTERWRASSFYPASRFSARIYRLLLRARAATGMVEVRAAWTDRWLLGEFVRDTLPQAVSAVVLVGTPGPAQKITARLQDKDGRILGYLKYAEKEAARSRIRREHRVLSVIPEGLGPQALKYGTMGSGKALLTTPIAGRRLPTNLPPAEGVADFQRSLASSSPASVDAHPWVQSVRERGGEEGDEQLDTCLVALEASHWPVVLQHGDFAPWNLVRRPEGTVEAFDWEYGTLKGFPYLDLAYYVLQTSALIYGWAPAKAARYTAGYLVKESQPELSSTEARSLTRLAAYAAYQNSLEDGQARDGGLQPWRRAIWEGAA